MPQLRLPTRWRFLSSGGLLLLVLLLAGCGGSSAGSSATMAPNTASGNAVPAAAQKQSASFAASTNKSSSGGPSVPDKLRMPQNTSQQRLIKTLNVTIEVKDTRRAANELQTWIGATDPQATSIGTNYNQDGGETYTITLNFSVQYTLYPKIYSYLSNYAPKDGGRLISLNESVQDVTNDYVDTQARIANDQNELQRLRALMQHTGSLSEVIELEQQISATEGDIETTQAHLNMLNNQTTMYTVNITIQPISSDVPPIQPNNGWDVGQTLHNALSASLAFGQALVNFVIWLLAFSIYIIPVIILIVLYRRYYSRRQQINRPVYHRPTFPSSPATPASSQPSAQPQPVPVGAAVGATDTTPTEEEAPINVPSSED